MRKGLTGNIHHGGNLLTSWKKRNEDKLKKRRISLPGYPSNVRFSDQEQINNYLNNEKLICLLCGKSYKFLTLHLVVHGHNAHSYKELFGIISEQGLVGTEIRKKMQDITIERNKGDLKEAIKSYNETRELSDYCHCGYLYNKYRRCRICDTKRTRRLKGYLPREIAAKTIVIVKCTNCGKDTPKSRLGQNRPKIFCDVCKKIKYHESQVKYNSNNRKRRSEMAKVARLKRQLASGIAK